MEIVISSKKERQKLFICRSQSQTECRGSYVGENIGGRGIDGVGDGG